MGELLSSSLDRCLPAAFTCATQPKVRRKCTGGLMPCHTSNGVFPFTLCVGARFRMKTAVVTASPQNQPGSAFAFIMLLAIPMTSANTCAVNSPPRSVRSVRSFFPASASARPLNRTIAAAAWSLELNNMSHMYRLRSSTRRRKYLLPLGVAGVTGPQMSPCTSSSLFSARYLAFAGNDSRLCLPAKQLSHT
ncbi:hypothetical protein U9M48_018363 [Paspalum notatum var. saurae]|uniref:Uncharacterized protein n=1 Tax=Paspalum notatum var. saurae TaxID=547442 RepID=A0AAQ3WPM2_PASNO